MTQSSKLSICDVEAMANQLRQDVITMLLESKSGHVAGPLGMADVFAALYFNVLKHDPANPAWPERDRLVLSNGHICPILYAAMAHAGYFSVEKLKTLRKFGSLLQGHPHNLALPGIENSSGPLGQGLSQAVGMALAARLNKSRHRVYCLMSDGEHDEGQTWEAVLYAGAHKLWNITAIIDRNNIQIDGFTEDVLPLEPFSDKYRAFNWNVIEVDGHNVREIIDACEKAKAVTTRPTVIIAFTIPGKGVDFMEFDYHWHGTPPKPAEAAEALRELRTLKGRITSGECE